MNFYSYSKSGTLYPFIKEPRQEKKLFTKLALNKRKQYMYHEKDIEN